MTAKPDEVRLLAEMQRVAPGDTMTKESPRVIAKRLGIPVKRSDFLFSKWSSKGWYEWGVCIDMGWLTEAGRTARAGDPAAPVPPKPVLTPKAQWRVEVAGEVLERFGQGAMAIFVFGCSCGASWEVERRCVVLARTEVFLRNHSHCAGPGLAER